MTDQTDQDQAREWPAGTADKINEWAESQLGFSLEPWQMDWLRQMEAPKPRTMTDQTDQETREAREWADYITSVRELHGTYASRARAAARFILDNTTPALPDLPDPLFGARATHPDHGDGIVASRHPDGAGEVQFIFQDDGNHDGTSYRWVHPSTLTFHTPDHPVILETEGDYRSSPEGTIVANNDERPLVLVDELWRHAGRGGCYHGDMSNARRRVLRWGWEA